ncbi:hypothetical protein [Syntrophobacter fumaroxidans]|uniref:Large polyvalent protein associated domain-containing protein n=1 Tax=Syntrophobacter fumaroxidans (strain DSM 10017 / MPOB) TaxID=335543 RepID=A0LQG5_SYNFM|nr:hypothetical protein [Syntrophobacter fumaroxidans]ABK19667.1 hypothetical protein Sfum_4001 [Syntrophobacter fumaroxidans MPOB]
MIVEIPDKNMELEFPDDMPEEQITQVIRTQVYGESAQPAMAPQPEQPKSFLERGFGVGDEQNAAWNAVSSPFPGADINAVLPDDPRMKGAVVGGILGSPLGPLGNIAGSGAGAMVGDLLSQMNNTARGNAPPDMEPLPLMGIPDRLDPTIAARTAGALGEGAAAGALGEGVAGLAKFTAPVVGNVLEETARMYGLPQMVVKSRPWLQSIVEATPGGKWMVDRYKRQFNDWALAEREAFVKEIAPVLETNLAVGEKWGEELSKLAQKPKQAYRAFEEGAPGVQIGLPESRNLAAQLYETGSPADRQWFDVLLNRGSLTTEEISKMLGGKKAGALSPEVKIAMRDSINSDLLAFDNARGSALAALRQEADDAYKNVMQNWSNNPLFVKLMRQYDPQMKIPGVGKSMALPAPERIIRTAFTSGDIEGLQAIKAAMPEDVFNMGLARFLENSLDAAMDRTGKILYPAKWAKQWETLGPKIEAFNPGLHKRMGTWTKMITKGEGMLPTAEAKHGGLIEGARKLGALATPGSFFAGPMAVGGAAVYNGFPMMAAYKWLGPEGKTLLRRYAESATQRQKTTAAGMATMNQFREE